MLLTQSLPPALGLFLVSYAFKFALAAEINQGCIPSLFSITGVYIAIIFYWRFNEVISCAKIIGMGLIIICVVFLAFDQKTENEDLDDSTMISYTAEEKRVYGWLSILLGLVAPFLWTFKCYFLRKTLDAKLFTSTLDLAIDCQIA